MSAPGQSLTLAEQIVLLTLDCPRHRVASALKIGGLPGLHEVARDLERREMIHLSRLHHPTAGPKAPLSVVHRRLNTIVRSVDPPAGADADLLLLVAFAGGLSAATTGDHLNARHRIAALDPDNQSSTPLLAKLLQSTGAESTTDLALKLLPGRVTTHPGESGPAVNSAVWDGGHGGGTVGGAQ